MVANLGLVVSVVATGLWSGLLLTLTTILHPVYGEQPGPAFARDLGRFLPVARRSPTNYVLVALVVLAPVVALVGLRDQPGGAPFLLTATGLLLTVAGPFVLSRFLAEPLYEVILKWDPEAVPDGWEAVRARWYLVNWLRAGMTWAAFALFLSAWYVYLT